MLWNWLLLPWRVLQVIAQVHMDCRRAQRRVQIRRMVAGGSGVDDKVWAGPMVAPAGLAELMHPAECPCTDCVIQRRIERQSRQEPYEQLVTLEDEVALAEIFAKGL
ncbi:MAG TPA: hypothetical protein VKQ11_00560 [Candidatus Sulfotelmatobacter sp.]|nr:hypothetical protein [Candidatus Sulfotelmatobacter sp.]